MKKYEQFRSDLTDVDKAQFRITSQGLAKGRHWSTRIGMPFSYRSAILKIMSLSPEETWTALELSHEDGGELPSGDYLQTLKKLEAEGLVARV